MNREDVLRVVDGKGDLSGVNLRDANLFDANLSGANLRGASLRGADLRDANLFDANLNYCIGNMEEICSMQAGPYMVVWTSDCMAVGCGQHPLEWWKEQTAETVKGMADDASDWWLTWWPIMQQVIETSKAIGVIYGTSPELTESNGRMR